MQKTAIRMAPPGARVLDRNGRAWVVLEDDFPGPVPGQFGWVKYVCDSSGRVIMVPGYIEATWFTPQPFDTMGFMLQGWQCDVN